MVIDAGGGGLNLFFNVSSPFGEDEPNFNLTCAYFSDGLVGSTTPSGWVIPGSPSN